MKQYIYFLLLFSNVFYAQIPDDWTVDRAFEFSMSLTGFINLDGIQLTSGNDAVGAFINGECRGIGKITQYPNNAGYYVDIGVFSDIENELITFKIYHHNNEGGVIREIDEKLFFIDKVSYGDAFQPYSFSNPTLPKDAELLSVHFDELEFTELTNSRDSTSENPFITISLNPNENVASLNAVFELSPGATIHFKEDYTEINSGQNSLDFSIETGSPFIEFTVLSADKSKTEDWKVIVVTLADIPSFSKKDAVCYKGGAIRVVFSYQQNTYVILKREDGITEITRKKFEKDGDDTVLFEDLDVGVYTLEHSQFEGGPRRITINLKNI